MNDVEKMMVLSAGMLVGNAMAESQGPISPIGIWTVNGGGSYTNVTNRSINIDYMPNAPSIVPTSSSSSYAGYSNVMAVGSPTGDSGYFALITQTPSNSVFASSYPFNHAYLKGSLFYAIDNGFQNATVGVGFNCPLIKKITLNINNVVIPVVPDGSGGYTSVNGMTVSIGNANQPFISFNYQPAGGRFIFGTSTYPYVKFEVGAQVTHGAYTCKIIDIQT